MDPSEPDDAPEQLSGHTRTESCYSVAGEDFYLLMVRVENPAGLERLQEIGKAANVTTRTTVVRSTPFEGRAPS